MAVILKRAQVFYDNIWRPTYTFSYANNADCLIICANMYNGIPDTITFNGIPMTEAVNSRGQNSGASVWILTGAPKMTANIYITGGHQGHMMCHCSSWDGISRQDTIRDTCSANGINVSQITCTLATLQNNDLCIYHAAVDEEFAIWSYLCTQMTTRTASGGDIASVAGYEIADAATESGGGQWEAGANAHCVAAAAFKAAAMGDQVVWIM